MRTKADIFSEKSMVHYVINASGGLMKLNAILLLKNDGTKIDQGSDWWAGDLRRTR